MASAASSVRPKQSTASKKILMKEDIIICTENRCVDDRDSDSLTCAKCKRSIHYRCCMLPAFHIQTLKANRTQKYICINCVEVEPKLLELVPKKEKAQPSLQTQNEIKRLRRGIDACEGIIKSSRDFEDHLKKQLEDKDADLQLLKNDLKADPGLHTLEFAEKKFERKLDEFKDSILSTIKNECQQAMKSYSEATKSGLPQQPTSDTSGIKLAIKQARDEEIALEMEKRRRATNIIVHGIKEEEQVCDNSDKNNHTRDCEWADQLVKDLHVSSKIKKIFRIGKKPNRPLLICLDSEDDKLKIMGNLPSLKGNDTYKGISITEDLCRSQREKYKELSQQAKDLNDDLETDEFIYRVRGSSKNGFDIKKVYNKTQKRYNNPINQ